MSNEILPSNSAGGDAKRSILIGVIVAVIVGGGLFYFMSQKQDDSYQSYDYENGMTEGTDQENENENETVDSAMSGYKTFMGSDLGFQMDYPEDWTVDKSSSYVAVSFMSPIEGEDLFAENVNFTTEDLTPYPGTTLDDYSEAALGQIATAMPEYVLVDQGARMLGDIDAGYLLGDYPLAGYNVEVLSVFAIDNETAYIITYTGEVETHDQFADTVETMLSSFKLL